MDYRYRPRYISKIFKRKPFNYVDYRPCCYPYSLSPRVSHLKSLPSPRIIKTDRYFNLGKKGKFRVGGWAKLIKFDRPIITSVSTIIIHEKS